MTKQNEDNGDSSTDSDEEAADANKSSGTQKTNKSSGSKKTKRKEREPPIAVAYQECPEPYNFSSADPDTEDWRVNLSPTVMNIVTQSIRKSQNNHFFESILLVQNLCHHYNKQPNEFAEFLDNTICQWEYKKDGKTLCGFKFPIRDDISIGPYEESHLSEYIEHMHYVISQVNLQMQEWKLHRDSIVLEIRGATRYVDNTWERLELVGLAFSVISFVLVEATYIPIANHPFRHSCLEFTFDLMVMAGRHKNSQIRFLFQLCLAVDNDFIEHEREQIRRLWVKHYAGDVGAVHEFLELAMEYSKAAIERGQDLLLILNHVEQMRDYLKPKKATTYMSFRFILSRAYKGNPPNEKPKRRTARPPHPPDAPMICRTSKIFERQQRPDAIGTLNEKWDKEREQKKAKVNDGQSKGKGDSSSETKVNESTAGTTEGAGDGGTKTAAETTGSTAGTDGGAGDGTKTVAESTGGAGGVGTEGAGDGGTKTAVETTGSTAGTDGGAGDGTKTVAESTGGAGCGGDANSGSETKDNESTPGTNGRAGGATAAGSTTGVAGVTGGAGGSLDCASNGGADSTKRHTSGVTTEKDRSSAAVTFSKAARAPPQKTGGAGGGSDCASNGGALSTKTVQDTSWPGNMDQGSDRKDPWREELAVYDPSHQFGFAHYQEHGRITCDYVVDMIKEKKTKYIVEARRGYHVMGFVRQHQYKFGWRFKTNGFFGPSSDDEHEERKWRSGLADYSNEDRTIVGSQYLPGKPNAFHRHIHYVTTEGAGGILRNTVNFSTIMGSILKLNCTDELKSSQVGTNGFVRRWVYSFDKLDVGARAQLRDIAMLVWATAKEFWARGPTDVFYDQCEAGPDGHKLRRMLLIDPSEGDQMGFSFGGVEVVHALGECEIDFGSYRHKGRPYEITMIFSIPLVRTHDNMLLYLIVNLKAGQMDTERRLGPFRFGEESHWSTQSEQNGGIEGANNPGREQ